MIEQILRMAHENHKMTYYYSKITDKNHKMTECYIKIQRMAEQGNHKMTQ
jgi:hypothetical protein